MILSNLALFTKVDDLNFLPRLPLATDFFVNASIASCRILRTSEDVKRCYPKDLIRQLSPECQTISTWKDLQRCLTGTLAPIPSHQNYTVHIIGERNSGTKWLTQEVQHCFPRNIFNLKARRDFIRSKHFFQPIRSGDFTRSIVVSMFRNPVDWAAAMRESPYHSPTHMAGFDDVTGKAIPLPWRDFIKTVWATKRTAFDLELIRNNRIHETLDGEICQQGFALHEVVPCVADNEAHSIPTGRARGYTPIYELRRDHTGRPFHNILDLRRDKVVNFALELPMLMRIGGYMAVRYEDMLRNGTRFVLEQIASMVGMEALPSHCQTTGPQPERLGRRLIPQDFRQYIEDHVDLATERLLGYKE